jgi:hypothetical protein
MGYSDFLFTFGLLFSALDAYNIGPSPIAATSVSLIVSISRCQRCCQLMGHFRLVKIRHVETGVSRCSDLRVQ